MSMGLKRTYLFYGLTAVVVLSLLNTSFAGEEKQYKKIDVGAGEMGVEATVIEGAPIKADQVLTK
ncbi:MAG: hypothetical protein KAJ08_09345, partial [Deltaproteobacteria bacterium]|nr:hypothetical protein [Deltaproteobacteria bacterium]